jgi:beta-glucosidase
VEAEVAREDRGPGEAREDRGPGEAREDRGPGEALLEFRAGSRLLAALTVPVTGDCHAWTTVAGEFPSPLDGVHDLCLTLRGAFRLAAFRFTSPRAADC